VIPAVYRELLRGRRTRRLLTGLGACALGDGMSAVGGPLVGRFGAAPTLVASGAATVLLAVAASVLWPEASRLPVSEAG
jgi:hypothetical protein